MITKDEAIGIASALIKCTGMAQRVNYAAVKTRFVNAMEDPEGINIRYPHMYIEMNDYWEVTFPFFKEEPLRGEDVTVTVDSITKKPLLLP